MGSVSQDAQQLPSAPVWKTLSVPTRRFILSAMILGFILLILVDVSFRLEYLNPGGNPAIFDGILYVPLDLSAAVYAALVVVSVLLVLNSKGTRNSEPVTARLGSAWMLISVLLVLDYLIDSFEPKIAVIILFVFVGLRYWKGFRNSYVSLVLSPLMVLIAAGDGLGHLGGQFCPSSGLDSCPVKAVSDLYLVMILLFLTYLTISSRDRRPALAPLAIVILVAALALLGLLLSP